MAVFLTILRMIPTIWSAFISIDRMIGDYKLSKWLEDFDIIVKDIENAKTSKERLKHAQKLSASIYNKPSN